MRRKSARSSSPSSPVPISDSRARSRHHSGRRRQPWMLERLEGKVLLSGSPSTVYVAPYWAGDPSGTLVGWDGIGHLIGTDAFSDIQDGVNAVAPGGTVYVGYPGAPSYGYVGPINIAKSLTLESVIETTLETSAYLPGSVTIEGGASVLMSGFTFAGGGTGIDVEDGMLSATNVTATGSIGVSIGDQGNATFTDSRFAGSDGGIVNSGTLNLVHCASDSSGVGIINSGTLSLINSAVDHNGVYGLFGSGGGIVNSGTLTAINCLIVNNTGNGNGGGIDNTGTLTIGDSAVGDNTAASGDGGGIDNEPGGTLTVSDSSIAANSAQSGGGISNAGTLRVLDSTIADNSAARGGGLENQGTLTAALTNSTIADNTATAGDGGGIWNSGTLAVTDDTLSGNAVAFTSTGGGGGIANESGGTLTLLNSTVADSSAAGSTSTGGGILNGGTLKVVNATIAQNAVRGTGTGGGLFDQPGGIATLDNSIIALNSDSTGPDDIAGAAITSTSGYDLVGTGGSGGLSNGANGNQVGVANPGLGRLANNGGPTQTIALLAGSPAIDAGSNALGIDPTTTSPLATDQRGFGAGRR